MKDYSFGNYICALRTQQGLSQFQLGALVGVTDKAVSKWENGDAKPRISTCYRLAEVLGVSISQLLSCKQMTVKAGKEMEKMKYRLWKEAYARLSGFGEAPACLSRLASEEAALRDTDSIIAFAAAGAIRDALRKVHSTMFLGGSVNSSFAAWLFGATNVNPLPPHYKCMSCGKLLFSDEAADGFDLPQTHCSCGGLYIRDGHNIPFEGYAKLAQLGTELEIRVAEEALPVATAALREFYAGKAELLPVRVMFDREVVRYVVLPEHKEKPPLAEDGYWHTDFNAYWQWEDGETAFTFLVDKRLDALHGTPMPEPDSLMKPDMIQALFRQKQEKLSYITDYIDPNEPRDFDLLLRIESLSHASDAWEDNGQQLVAEKTATVRQLPASREDIWHTVYEALKRNGIYDSGLALTIMEEARKGKFCSMGIPERIRNAMELLKLPQWYPGYMEKVKYLFPKGHGVAYLLIDALIQWKAQCC